MTRVWLPSARTWTYLQSPTSAAVDHFLSPCTVISFVENNSFGKKQYANDKIVRVKSLNETTTMVVCLDSGLTFGIPRSQCWQKESSNATYRPHLLAISD